MLTDRGILQHSGHSWRIVSDGDIPVPDTVQALIAARMDTLSPERKSLLHDAAVMGRVFWPGALATMGGAETARRGQRAPRPAPQGAGATGASLLDAGRGRVHVLAHPRPGRGVRPDPARPAGGASPEGGRLDRASRRGAGRRPRRHPGPPLPAGHRAGRSGRRLPDAELRAAAGRYLYLAGERASNLDGPRSVALFQQALGLIGLDHPDLPPSAPGPRLGAVRNRPPGGGRGRARGSSVRVLGARRSHSHGGAR